MKVDIWGGERGFEKIAQKQLSTFVFTTALRNKNDSTAAKLHNFRTNGNFIVAILLSLAIYNLNNRFIAFNPTFS